MCLLEMNAYVVVQLAFLACAISFVFSLQAQYIFCYRALLDYVESLENYSNLK